MTPGKVKRLLFEFMADIYFGPANNLKNKWDGILDELGGKLSKVLSKESEVDEYLNNTLVYIDDLNKYFAKQGRGKVPYSKLFVFANKDERISEFLVDKGLKKKLLKASGIELAGFDSEVGEDSPDIIYEDEVYGSIYSLKNRGIFFSPAVNKLVVQYPDGKVLSYSLYRKKAKKKNRKYIKLSRIYKVLLDKDKNSTMEAFQGRMRYLFAKNRKKKNGARISKKKGL